MVTVKEDPLVTLRKKIDNNYETMKQIASKEFDVRDKIVDFRTLMFYLYLNGKQIGHVYYNANQEIVRITGNPVTVMAFAERLEKNSYKDVSIWTQ